MKAPRSVLVAVPRRIGDVLLTTPLVRSLKRAWPQADIDVLVFAGTEGVLAANPDIRRVITVPERPSLRAHLTLAARILRRYDIALSAVPGDRPTLYAWLAGRWRGGLLVDAPSQNWKKRLLQRWVPFDDMHTHTVRMNLALADMLDIAPCHEVVSAWTPRDREVVNQHLQPGTGAPYAVIHPYPKFAYKMWTREGWLETARWLQQQGLRVVYTGGRDPAETAYVGALAQDTTGAIDLSGKLTLAQAACTIAHAKIYIGPDTALTHMAAALAVPVIALYGPGNIVKWGPWPARYAGNANPWRSHGSQRVNNVTLLQATAPCVPCHAEGCDRHVDSLSDCLQRMPAGRVIAAIGAALETTRSGTSTIPGDWGVIQIDNP